MASARGTIAKSFTKPTSLYRHLLRECRQLPDNVQDYYKHYWRQQFNSHSDETDPERIQAIMDQAVKDMEWIRNKVSEVQTGG